MEAAKEAGADRTFGVKNLDVETNLPTSVESSSLSKPSQLSDNQSHGYVPNVIADIPRANKGGAIRGEQTIKEVSTTFSARVLYFIIFSVLFMF